MDLSKLNTAASSDSGIVLDILHPATNLPLGLQFIVFGTDSKPFRDTMRRQRNRRLELANGRRTPPKITDEALEAESLDVLVACTKDWQTVDKDGAITPTIELTPGEYAVCTPEKVRAVYADPGYAWLREQVDRAIGDRDNFLGK